MLNMRCDLTPRGLKRNVGKDSPAHTAVLLLSPRCGLTPPQTCPPPVPKHTSATGYVPPFETCSKNERRTQHAARHRNSAVIQYGVSSPRSPPIELPTDFPGVSPTTRRYQGSNTTAGVINADSGDVDPLKAMAGGTPASNAGGVTLSSSLKGMDDATDRLFVSDVPVHDHHAVAGPASVKGRKAGRFSKDSEHSKDNQDIKDGSKDNQDIKDSKYSKAREPQGTLPGQPRSFLSESSAVRAWADGSAPIKKSDREKEGEQEEEEGEEGEEEEDGEEEEGKEEGEGGEEEEAKGVTTTVERQMIERRLAREKAEKKVLQYHGGGEKRAVTERGLNGRPVARETVGKKGIQLDGEGVHRKVIDLAPKVLLAREMEAARRREERAAAARKEEEEQLRQSTAFRAKEVWVD